MEFQFTPLTNADRSKLFHYWYYMHIEELLYENWSKAIHRNILDGR